MENNKLSQEDECWLDGQGETQFDKEGFLVLFWPNFFIAV